MNKHPWLRWTLAATLLVLAACNSDDNSSKPADTPTPQATNTANAVPTATVEPEATETPAVEPHMEVEIGSSEDGAGQLVADFDFSTVFPLYFTQCFGGTDENCTGGQALFSDANPGFLAYDHAAGAGAAIQGAIAGIFPLAATAEVTIEIVAIDSGLSLRFEDVTLDTPGDSTLLGAGDAFHTDGETLLLIDDRNSDAVYSLTFRLSGNGDYTDSEEYTLLFQPSNDIPPPPVED